MKISNTGKYPIKVLVWAGKLENVPAQQATDGTSSGPEIEEHSVVPGTDIDIVVPEGGRLELREIRPVDSPFDQEQAGRG